jgi:23S rRNA (uracil1939-C5)-methyltransferase
MGRTGRVAVGAVVGPLRVDRMARDGEGVATLDTGMRIFVAGALPGETVRAVVTEAHAQYAKARVQEILIPAKARIRAPCPVYGACGGCSLQHWDYAAELAYKEQRLRDALQRIGGLEAVPLEPIRGAPSPYGYRSKGSFPWSGEAGRLALGLYARATHTVVPVASCQIQHPLVNRVLGPAIRIANRLGLEPYHEATGTGLLRHLVVRASRFERRVAVTVVATRRDPRLELFARDLMRVDPVVKGVAGNWNPTPGNRILGPATEPLAGDPQLVEAVLGATFSIAPDAFFQVNVPQAEVLFGAVLDAAGAPAETWDLYAGVGVLAVLLARAGHRVTAVEEGMQAAAAARHNAGRNGVALTVVADRVERFVAERNAPRPSLVVVDPPRHGLLPAVSEALLTVAPKRLLYVSCAPETLARDLRVLATRYRVARVLPVDFFPRTDHVESLTVLEDRET